MIVSEGQGVPTRETTITDAAGGPMMWLVYIGVAYFGWRLFR